MKRFLTLLLAVLLVLGVCACGKEDDDGVSADGVVKIEFFGWGDVEEQANYQTLVNQFNAENDDILVSYKAESSTTYMTTLEQRSTNLPDIFYMPDYEFLEWVANGMLLDISDYVTDDDLSKLWAAGVDEYYFNPKTRTLGNAGGGAKLYGLPKDLGPFTLVYNKTLLDSQIQKLGLDSEAIYGKLAADEPMTWQEFRTLLKTVDPDPNDSLYGISHYEMDAAVYSNDADYFSADASEQKITEKNFYDAVQFIADLTLVDRVMPSADDQISTNGYQRFKAGGCVFSFMGPWDCADFWKSVNFEYDIAPVPYNGENPDAHSVAWVGSMGYCINAKLKKKTAKVEACMRLANYLCYNETAQRKFYELGQQVPNIVSMATDEYVNDTQGLLANKNPASRSVWVDTIQNDGASDKVQGKVRARYYTYQSDWYDLLTEHFTTSGMWKGTTTAQAACASFADTLQAALDDMRANYLG